jgi:ATP-dependent protease Clp ATPase subunit
MIKCDFCDKDAREVVHIIASKNHVHICGECVLEAVKILGKEVK